MRAGPPFGNGVPSRYREFCYLHATDWYDFSFVHPLYWWYLWSSVVDLCRGEEFRCAPAGVADCQTDCLMDCYAPYPRFDYLLENSFAVCGSDFRPHAVLDSRAAYASLLETCPRPVTQP